MMTTKRVQVNCAAIEAAVRRARREEGPTLADLRAAIRSGLQAPGRVHPDGLAGALHCAALAKSSLDRREVADLREPELVLALLATAAAELDHIMQAVTVAIERPATPRPAPRA